MSKVPAFSDLGRSAKDVLYGGREGVFQFNNVLSVSSTTSDGVNFNVRALNKEGRLDVDLKSVYNAPRYSLVSTVTPAGKLGLALTYKEVAPGVTLNVSGTLPDPDSAKASVDYRVPHLALRSVVSLGATPKVDLQASTGADGFTVGGVATFDSAKNAITKWSAGAAYAAPDYAVSAIVDDKYKLSLLVAHAPAVDTSLGAEVTKPLQGDGPAAFAVGAAKRLPGGALAKAKLQSSGLLSLLYEQKLAPNTVVALSAQVDSLNLDKAPKYGVGFAVKY